MALATPPNNDHQPAFDAVIWDYDGTLVATRAADEYAVEMLLRSDPGAAEGVALFWALDGRPIQERIDNAWPGRFAEIMPLFENDVQPVPFVGVMDVLDDLRRGGYRMGVVSSRRRHTLEWGLERTGIGAYLDIVVGLDDVSEPKPSPEGLLKALRGVGIAPTRAVYVGDSEVDVLAGRRAGTTAWRATWAQAVDDNSIKARLLTRPADVLDLVIPRRADA